MNGAYRRKLEIGRLRHLFRHDTFSDTPFPTPRDRDLVAQVHSIKRRVLPSGKVSFDAERSARGGHADRFWAIALACQKERGPGPKTGTEIGVRVIG
jgi:phage FluMu gp28-like protein